MGRHINSVNKKNIWKTELFDDNQVLIQTNFFPNYKELLKVYIEFGNRWSLLNFYRGKYKLTGRGLTPVRKYLYSHIKIFKIGGKKSARLEVE